jgi:hypothetical protein
VGTEACQRYPTPAQDRFRHLSDDWFVAHRRDHVEDLIDELGVETRRQVYYQFELRGVRKACTGRLSKRGLRPPPVEVVAVWRAGCWECSLEQAAQCRELVRSGCRLPCEKLIDWDDWERYGAPAEKTVTKGYDNSSGR